MIKRCNCSSCKYQPNTYFRGVEKDGKVGYFNVNNADFDYALEVLKLTGFQVHQVIANSRKLTHQAKFIRGQWILREV